ncbi:class I SAM-dependent methyltransferase [Marinibacterium profundimaris]|uniref:class I SAM-dependent methyltransferase n=1 Tax=Marinibacterium profundimaris TaxID=1679460 RepID=UPI000B5234DE|nr:class I SAM-dependent methyltransferase [Marinibacterium profundimaris]
METDTTRFDGLAEAYDAYRRPYPRALFRDLAGMVPASAHCAVDVGAGTGISTEGLLQHLPGSWMVIGVEPGDDMRRVLTRRLQRWPNVQANPSVAEAIHLPDRSAGLVSAFTAVHWFEPGAFFAEARRLLVPGGILALGRNRRRPEGAVAEIDAFVREHSEVLRDMTRWEKAKMPLQAQVEAVEGFHDVQLRSYAWSERVSMGDLLDLYLTRATVMEVVRGIGLRAFRDRFETICAAHHGLDPFELRWDATLLTARRG